MSKDKAICCDCGGKLTTYELNDNIYAGINDQNYLCYACQPTQSFVVDDNPYEDDEDDDDF